jgi:hypothetical protein
MLPQEWKGTRKSLNLILLEFVKHSWAFMFLLHYCVLIWDLSYSFFLVHFLLFFLGRLVFCKFINAQWFSFFICCVHVSHSLSCSFVFVFLTLFLLLLLHSFAFWCSYSFILLWALTISHFIPTPSLVLLCIHFTSSLSNCVFHVLSNFLHSILSCNSFTTNVLILLISYYPSFAWFFWALLESIMNENIIIKN